MYAVLWRRTKWPVFEVKNTKKEDKSLAREKEHSFHAQKEKS